MFVPKRGERVHTVEVGETVSGPQMRQSYPNWLILGAILPGQRATARYSKDNRSQNPRWAFGLHKSLANKKAGLLPMTLKVAEIFEKNSLPAIPQLGLVMLPALAGGLK
ncbi:hypothetical protein E4631_10130 [Hymenobacter sp. UV11]|nr:hypothetical protein E4631_10130 [Hymenobacter sp. UV11]